MAEDFYPFVENAPTTEAIGVVRHPARIAVYDDAAAAPRVVVVEPKDVRSYLEEITLQVTQLSQGQGGTIPFMVIREIVENLIHAYFMEPTVSILNHGNTIRFSDQGPGIREKERALQYGTTSATEEMRRYIRGVGSGLPYAQQYMVDKGGSLTIDDNIAGGTIVTISIGNRPQTQEMAPSQPQGMQQQAPAQQMQGFQQQGYAPYPDYQQQQQMPQPYGQQGNFYQQVPYYPYQYPPQQQMGYPPNMGGYQQQMPQPNMYPPNPYQAPMQTSGYPQQMPGQASPWPAQPQPTDVQVSQQNLNVSGTNAVDVTVRGKAIIDYLREHDSVGPSDLARTYGESQPTWTRELQTLEEAGILRKDGQKRRLTTMGRSLL